VRQSYTSSTRSQAAGGVESHIYLLAQTLIQRGHKVIVITHAHPPFRYGVRYLTLGLKVYYLPLRLIPPAQLHATLPNLFLAFPLLRQVFIREGIQLIHAHAALSNLGLEAILHARTMGIKAVFTDHSLLGLGGFGEIWGNKMLKACLSDVDGVICVSKAGCVYRSLQRPAQRETDETTLAQEPIWILQLFMSFQALSLLQIFNPL
jgi:phosphatidylinositol glycan class A protein